MESSSAEDRPANEKAVYTSACCEFLLLLGTAVLGMLALDHIRRVTTLHAVFTERTRGYHSNGSFHGVQTLLWLAGVVRQATNQQANATEPEGRVINGGQHGIEKTRNSTTTTTTTTTTTKPAVLTIHPTTSKASACRNPFKKVYDQGRNFICCQLLGRLGNMMFVFASSYGIAHHTNRTLVADKQIKLAQFFDISVRLEDDYKCVVFGSKGLGSRMDCSFDQRMFAIPKGDNYCVGSYLQSFKYFDIIKDKIKRQFTFKKTIREKASNVIKSAIETYHRRKSNSTRPVLVGVHIRRGDMVGNKYGYNVATPQYMKKAQNYFASKYKNLLFIVCSNGMEWAKIHITGSDVVYVEGNSPAVDMSTLVSCDHTITTVGSFSWWAGYLNTGTTVYYQWPAKENSNLRKQYSPNYSDFFPSDWVGMS